MTDLDSFLITGVLLVFSGIGVAWLWGRLTKKGKFAKRERVDINKMMIDRTCKHGPSSDFRLYYVSDEVIPSEFFNYAMSGLRWPEIKGVFQKNDFVYANMLSLNKYGERDDLRIWFFGRESQTEFVKELAILLCTYEKAGCPPLEVEESVESIVARARGDTVDLLNKYGFVWSEGS
ncbi:hypothetical protein B7N40_24470 [Salmonella enterica subsp. enterica serovar Bovismorbificans]|nr:hypothetical protein [Salmonella enterica subsp. enterica serovar Bovismorbificans]